MNQKRFLTSAILFAVSFAAVCCIGRYSLSLNDIVGILAGREPDIIKASVFLNIRLPRIIFAAINGAALSISGYVYQDLFAILWLRPMCWVSAEEPV